VLLFNWLESTVNSKE